MKENTFALRKNTKPKTEKSPPYTGSINVNGVEYWLSGFINENEDGSKYFGGFVNPKNQAQSVAKPAPSPRDAIGDDDIPF
jgi:hypothetical protein